ncbi:hemolysin family protein [Mesobacillus selenatarsenatis]|uniref:Hemolysins and related proteins containing CBS domains n=1 Tax=Mesobacillus selenatarsenatis (strain DSM 18680 / JCM 14380 / FERM P-15431 / SF-1) TaxID=1321606 RepID=A0A0A8X1I2_MESS1|nr:hemolysin family protein [Mesobacillus selenatarsenatis]GAM13124.1 hemolysins and related proteins containing CBS domains [Mesobacillus selenatarsenatis SF-1]
MIITNLFLVVLLIALTGFFVATEFAIVKVRSSRIDQLITEGRKGAQSAKHVITHLDEYLSACQLGITITALGLGWLGEPTVEEMLHPVFERFHLNPSLSSILSFGIAFASITFLHVVVGELAPKTVAIQKAEAVTLAFSKPIIWFYKIMYPFIWALNGSARILVGLFGLKSASEHEIAHSEEELRILLSESYESGEINQNELNYVNNIFEFDERIAKEIMVPRTEIVTFDISDDIDTIIDVIQKEKYTRYPVIDGEKDNIVGMINIKEILTAKLTRKDLQKESILSSFIKPVIRVIETIPIHDLLVKMQKERIHMAILIDEYGGTSGLVTVEDILEEIVGDIRDEFDVDEIAEIRKVNENHYLFSSRVLIDEVNDVLGIYILEEEVDTIGGWFMTKNIDAEIGDEIEEQGYIFKIIEIDEYHIAYLEVLKMDADEKPD